MINNREAEGTGKVTNVPISVGPVTTQHLCLVVRSSRYGLIIGRPSMKTMRDLLDFDKNIASFRLGNGVTSIPLVTERSMENNSNNDEFSSDDEYGTCSEYEEDLNQENHEEHGELVLTLNEKLDLGNEGDQETQLNEALGHLPTDQRGRIRSALQLQTSIVAWKLDDLSSAEVSYQHSFQLNDHYPINSTVRLMPCAYDGVAETEIEKMLKSRLIKPAGSPWAFTVVIERKSNGNPAFLHGQPGTKQTNKG